MQLHNQPQKLDNISLSSGPRVIAEISRSALVHNYHKIQEWLEQGVQQGSYAKVPQILPMIKANGYGHGATWVAKSLMHQKHLAGFGVATLDEAKTLRECVDAHPIIVFSETLNLTLEKLVFCEFYHISPVIGSLEDWNFFIQHAAAYSGDIHLEFNTGLNRLGIASDALAAVLDNKNKHVFHRIQTVFTHCAISDDWQHAVSKRQFESFKHIIEAFGACAYFSGKFHMFNSGGIFRASQQKAPFLTHMVRPGIALYGAAPFEAQERVGALDLKPVMRFGAQVIAKHCLHEGESIGYNATYTVPAGASQWVAIVSAGYADGLLRQLSNRGEVWLEGKCRQFLGVVSMDMCAIACDKDTSLGAMVRFWGWDQGQSLLKTATAAQTIPYCLLTGLSSRVHFEYSDA